MKFETLGNPSQPAVLLIHGSLCSAASSRSFGKELARDYYVVMPTLDGHCGDGTDYTSVQAQAAKILQYLMSSGITRLAMLHGSSMGAVIALEMARQNAVLQSLRGPEASGLEIGRYVLDGGVFFRFPAVVRWVMRLSMNHVVRGLRLPDKTHAVDKTLYSMLCRGMFGKKPDGYRPMVEIMYEACADMSKASVQGIVESCYNVALPDLGDEAASRCWFHFSTLEPAYYMKKTLLAKYPQASFKDVNDPGHLWQQVNDPQAYAAYLRAILDGTAIPDPKPQPAAKPEPKIAAQPEPEAAPQPADDQPAAQSADSDKE